MLDPATGVGVGLFTNNEARVAVPLAGVSIEADLRSVYAKVVVTQRYINQESTPIEAVYVFPLDESAAVCGFEAVIDGTLVVGEIHEREKAFDLYDDAMEQGHGAYLLDEERPDVFQASIGNLPPGKEVLVRLTYVTELTIEEQAVRFVIPTTVSPRYAPAEDQVGTGRPDSEALNPPVAWNVPYGLNLSVHLTMPGRISRIESPSHPISITLNEAQAAVSLAQKDVALDRDFVLSIDAAGLDAPQAFVEHDDDGAEAIGVAFCPRFETRSAPAELIFLVDRSGSMGGPSIEEVRRALQLCLRSMTPGCRFNIVGFGSHYEALFPETRSYDQGSMEAASAHVTALEANLGGTELLPALRFVLDQPPCPELPRQVVVLTDGEVTNTDAVIELASSHARGARIFTFGIGAGASHHLVRGLARAGRGSAEFIYPGERIEPKVLRQFARLLSPGLTDVRIDWKGAEVTQAPVAIPPIFAGGRLLVYGFVKEHRPATARLSATSPSGPISFDVPIEHVARGSGRIIATLAARARIRELEEGEWLTTRGSRQHARKQSSVKKEIVALGTRYGLISRETSFVAIERRDTPVTGDVKLRKVPIALTTGWGGLEQQIFAARSMPMRSALSAAAPQPSGIHAGTVMLGAERSEIAQFRVAESEPERLSRRQRTGPAAPVAMQSLVMLQSADGSWELTPELAEILGREVGELTAAAARATGPQEEMLRAWATALALVWLQLNAAAVEDEWRLLGAKARRWLDHTQAVAPGGRTWIDAARRFLASLP